MTAQHHLFTPPAPTVLSDRQQTVLELLQQQPAGLRSTDIGRYLHMARNAPCACASTSPDSTSTCKWAHSDGERIGKQLRRLEPPLAKKYHGLWDLTAAARPRDTGELPDGF